MILKEMLSSSRQMKFLSLFLAFTLWLFVNLETGDEIEIPLSISYVNIPAGLAVKVDPASLFSVRVEGPKILLLRQKLKGVSLKLDLSGAKEGKIVYQGLERSVMLIKGVKPLRVSPPMLELGLVSRK